MVLTLVPQPVSVIEHDGSLSLRPDMSARVEGGAGAALTALVAAVAGRTGAAFAVAEGAESADIVLRRTDADDEAYRLVIGAGIELSGSEAGLLHGIRTLTQLLTDDGDGWSLPHVEIEDAPRFAYRGVMLDVSRTFFDVETVKAFIERAASLKFNRVHLHLSDDQGWRLEIRSRPLLTERASASAALGRPGGFYTQDEFREIVAFAAERRIVIVPEIDLPGHTHALGVAHPEVIEEPVISDDLVAQAAQLGQPLPVKGEPFLGWAVGHSSVKIHDEATWELLRDVLGELAELSPGPYLHIGGDEALGTAQADFDVFIERVTRLVAELGKTPMAWHEAGSADVARGTVGQFWGSTSPTAAHAADARRFAENGGGLVLSPSNTAYLDQKYDADFPLGISWAGLIDLETAYSWEPTEIVPGLDPAAVLGIEGPLWAETLTDLADIDQLFFPRAAALAEIGWSAASDRDWVSFRDRVGGLGAVWDAAGWGGHRPAEVPWSGR